MLVTLSFELVFNWSSLTSRSFCFRGNKFMMIENKLKPSPDLFVV